MNNKPTEKQKQVLEYINTNSYLVSPTIRQIANNFKVYPGTIQTCIRFLMKKGLIQKNGRRILQLTNEGIKEIEKR